MSCNCFCLIFRVNVGIYIYTIDGCYELGFQKNIMYQSFAYRISTIVTYPKNPCPRPMETLDPPEKGPQNRWQLDTPADI